MGWQWAVGGWQWAVGEEGWERWGGLDERRRMRAHTAAKHSGHEQPLTGAHGRAAWRACK